MPSGSGRFGYLSLTICCRSDYRTVTDIKNEIAERSKQNAFLRTVHAKNNSQTIADWKSDLDRVLLIFNVRTVVSLWLACVDALVVYSSQTELGLNTYAIASDVRDGVTETHTVVSEVQRGVADTHAMVSDIHRSMMRDQRRLVSDTWVIPTTEYVLTRSAI